MVDLKKEVDSTWRDRVRMNISALESVALLIPVGIRKNVIDSDQAADILITLIDKLRSDIPLKDV